MFAEVLSEAIVFGFRLQIFDWVRFQKLMEIQVDLRIYVFQHENHCPVEFLLQFIQSIQIGCFSARVGFVCESLCPNSGSSFFVRFYVSDIRWDKF
jgi:hypothetical protein